MVEDRPGVYLLASDIVFQEDESAGEGLTR